MAFGINKILKLLSLRYIWTLIKRNRILKKHKDKSLKIGLNCSVLNCNFGNKVFIGNKTVLINSEIGTHSYINSNTEIRNTKIGKYCSIASNVKIVLGYHPSNLISTHPAFYSNNKAFETFADKTYFEEYKDVIIGNDVWIGNNVIIPGGISIGDGAIIASGAIVTKDVEPYSVVGGIPAKLIKYRFNKGQIELLLKTKWWDKSDEWLKNNYKLFLNTNTFFSYFGAENK